MTSVKTNPVNNLKCVILVDRSLPTGLAANTAAMLAFSAGSLMPELIGKDIADRSGRMHCGLLQIPLPILSASQQELQQLLRQKEQLKSECLLLDFSTLAQSCKTYDEFETRLAETDCESMRVSGLLLSGPKKTVTSLCGSLPLYRGHEKHSSL